MGPFLITMGLGLSVSLSGGWAPGSWVDSNVRIDVRTDYPLYSTFIFLFLKKKQKNRIPFSSASQVGVIDHSFERV